MMVKIDNKPLPKLWDRFITNESKEHNLLIKNGNECYCTCCKTIFQSNARIGNLEICPNCKQKLKVRSKMLKYDCFIKYLTLLDKEDGQLFIRLFELRSIYYYEHKCFNHNAVEYGRIVINQKCHLLNNRATLYMSSFNVHHYRKIENWRKYCGCYTLSSRGKLYPYNIKKILKDTAYEYSYLWDFIKKVKGCDLENLLTGVAKKPSFEFLVKMKLYNLALAADKFNENGSFHNRFGLDKKYFNFIKKYNLCYEELEILRLLKLEDIKKIRYLKNKIGIYVVKEISKYIDIKKIFEYKNGKFDVHLYLDYLRFASELGMNLKDKKILFPKDLKEEHNKLNRRIKIINDLKTKENIARRYKELLDNKYQNEIYVVFPAPSVNALKNESKQQNHCVQSYAGRYGNGECDIYFMRYKKNKSKSLVTIEVKNNKIVQKRKKDNELTEEQENVFLKMWEKTVLQKCRI